MIYYRTCELDPAVKAQVFAKLFFEQKGLCAVCGQERAHALDHDHQTNLIRGLVCFRCNSMLAWLDRPSLLAKGASYLQRHNSSALDFLTRIISIANQRPWLKVIPGMQKYLSSDEELL